MKKAEAQEIADRYILAINVHYQNEIQTLRKIESEARQGVRRWIDSGAYRKKGYERPHVPGFRMQPDYACNVLRALEAPGAAETAARLQIRELLNGPNRQDA